MSPTPDRRGTDANGRLQPPTLSDIEAAAARLSAWVYRTPLIPLHAEGLASEVYLKLECLQPVGSFKPRGAANALALADPEQLREGVSTASAGNMALGVAWCARRLGIPCRVVVPEQAPAAKLDALASLGAEVTRVSFEKWWELIVRRRLPDLPGHFVHPVADRSVIAGNATIGLEIVEDLPEVDTVLVPFGGGGLGCGIASALRILRPRAEVIACEVDTAAPLTASLAAGEPRSIERVATFVDGIGGASVLDEMWPLVRSLIAGSRVASLLEVEDAIRHLAIRHRTIAEGAGAAPVAIALRGDLPPGKVVCVVSGGNLDVAELIRILGAPGAPG